MLLRLCGVRRALWGCRARQRSIRCQPEAGQNVVDRFVQVGGEAGVGRVEWRRRCHGLRPDQPLSVTMNEALAASVAAPMAAWSWATSSVAAKLAAWAGA